MNVKHDAVSDYSSSSERLYLLKEDNKEVYVDCPLLQQHQIDALRFLYKAFHKKFPGAVINFPPSCGKSTTVALYLRAVSQLLKDPVFILCKDEDEIQYWKGILLKWSSYVEDVIAVESLNPFVKGKRVFLNTRESLASHLRRHWSVTVAKENMDICKLKFDTDFKIYITSTDIKKDLSLLSTVYTWLYPKPKHNILDFATKDKCSKERFRRSVQLDVILEDVAIRRYVNLKPFESIEKTSHTTDTTDIHAHVETKRVKNKDATGTKIKRSKKVTTPASSNVLANYQIENKESHQNVHLMNETTHNNCTVTIDEIENESNIHKNHESKSENNPPIINSESFVCNQKQLHSQDDFNELSCLYNDQKPKRKYKFYESLHIDSQVDQNEVEIKDVDKNELLRKCLLQSLGNNKENNTKINMQEKDKDREDKSLSDNYSNIDLRERKDLNKNVSQKLWIESFQASFNDEDVKIELKNELNEDDVKSELKNEINHDRNKINESILNVDEFNDIQSYSVNIVKESQKSASGLKKNVIIKEEPEEKVKKVVNISDKRKSDDGDKDLDDKIAVMEENALKKFKGSLLDSIF